MIINLGLLISVIGLTGWIAFVENKVNTLGRVVEAQTAMICALLDREQSRKP